MIKHLAPLPVEDGVYLSHENCNETWTRFNLDHPAMLGVIGMFPESESNPYVNKIIFEKTLDKVIKTWKWDVAWSTDFALTSIAASYLKKPELALEILLSESSRNRYAESGACHQFENLPVYLPGNGSLLMAIAKLCKKMIAKSKKTEPLTFGKWKIVHEGFSTKFCKRILVKNNFNPNFLPNKIWCCLKIPVKIISKK